MIFHMQRAEGRSPTEAGLRQSGPGCLFGAGGALAAQALVRSGKRRLLSGHASVGDVRRTVQDAALVGPDETGAPAAIDRDRDRVRKVAVAVVERAEDAVRADSADVH